jgi:RNA polymerase sigma factor (sigma-70 family)
MSLGRQSEFEAFCRQEYEALFRYLYCITGNVDDAVEGVQESFLRLHELEQKRCDVENRRALLFRLARNLAIDVLRRRNVRADLQRNTGKRMLPIEFPPTPEDLLREKELRGLVEAALEELPEKQRTCLLLRNSGLSYRQIAGIVHLDPESIGPALGRALRRFKAIYAGLLETKPAVERAWHDRLR